jgi:rSAM/selenodomain-associated transferase 2
MPDNPLISIIIPALNEQDVICGLISHIRSPDGFERAEIVIVDGASDRGTLKAITDREVIKLESPRGRGLQMNEGAKAAKGTLLLFLHADTTLPRNALTLIDGALQDGHHMAGAFDLGIRSEKPIFRIIECVSSLRPRITRIPFGDQTIFMRKQYFETIGGFQEISLMEDVEIMGRIRRAGDAIVILKEKVYTSPRRWEKEGILYCTLRNWLLQIFYLFGASPEKTARFYKPPQ